MLISSLLFATTGKKKRMPSGELYREYCKLVEKSVVDRAYRNYMKRIVELGLVKVEGKRRWKIYEVV